MRRQEVLHRGTRQSDRALLLRLCKWQKWLKKDEIRLFNHGVKVENASLLERLKARIEESAIKVSTVKAPHTYMKAVGTRELEKILEEELGNEDTK